MEKLNNEKINTAQTEKKKESNSEIIFAEDGFSILIAANQLSVAVNLFAPQNENGQIMFSKIKSELINAGIKTEIQDEVIKSAVVQFNNDKIPVSGIVVSVGADNQKGKDGWFELLCGDKLNNESKGKFDGKIDGIISLKQDDLIGAIHMPLNGKDGMDVFGKIIPAEHGKKYEISLGENVYTKEKIIISIYSSIDGFLNIKSNIISVTELLTIYEDIDYRCGNIIGYGSIKVLGNVMNGYYLNLKNNIDVGGYVGDSELVAGNNIKILGGFMGAGSGKIKAGGNIDVKFVQDQQIYCRGSLNFIREIVHSKIYVKDNITGKGNHASIIGGYTVAGKGIEIYSCGNEYGLNTIIEAGYDYEIKDILLRNRTKINELKKELKKIDKDIFGYTEMKRLNEAMYKKLKLLADRHKEIIDDMKKLNDENKELIQAVRKYSGAYVKILNTIYPGTKITINRKSFLVKEKLFSKTFQLSEDKEIILV